ncbi:hypothetical protein B0J18DRAFT_483469 [Chaetomium sp. MPI-SDFR-AT-0129]|nr:hypothetical protein B0J18DRAFT_483469 [Chaetomium sp. MPI-SDFR-AT-0129]
MVSVRSILVGAALLAAPVMAATLREPNEMTDNFHAVVTKTLKASLDQMPHDILNAAFKPDGTAADRIKTRRDKRRPGPPQYTVAEAAEQMALTVPLVFKTIMDKAGNKGLGLPLIKATNRALDRMDKSIKAVSEGLATQGKGNLDDIPAIPGTLTTFNKDLLRQGARAKVLQNALGALA